MVRLAVLGIAAVFLLYSILSFADAMRKIGYALRASKGVRTNKQLRELLAGFAASSPRLIEVALDAERVMKAGETTLDKALDSAVIAYALSSVGWVLFILVVTAIQ